METNTVNVILFNQVATKRHLNLNTLMINSFSNDENFNQQYIPVIFSSKKVKNNSSISTKHLKIKKQ